MQVIRNQINMLILQIFAKPKTTCNQPKLTDDSYYLHYKNNKFIELIKPDV